MIELVTTGGADYPNLTIGKKYKTVSTAQYWITVLDDNNEEFEIPNWMAVAEWWTADGMKNV